MSKKNEFVKIRPEGSSILVHWSLNIFYKPKESGRLACSIPSFNINFTANDTETVVTKGKALTRIFFDHFFVHSKNGLKNVALELQKLGYRTDNNAYTIHKFSHNQVMPTKFKNGNMVVPTAFQDANQITVESEMQVA
ncbi:MAG: hypothetical protein WKF91_09355 [Segetibacter sp.]